MAGSPKKRMRREALAKAARGEKLTDAERELLDGVAGAETEEKADDEDSGRWWASLPEEVIALLRREIDEPETRTFSHRAVQRMALQGGKDRDIATLLGIDKKVLQTEAKGALELGRTQYRFLITHRQFTAGMSGDRFMLMWLGKNGLGQSDKVQGDWTVEGTITSVQEAAQQTREKLTDLRNRRLVASTMDEAIVVDETFKMPAWRTEPDAPAEEPDFQSPSLGFEPVLFSDQKLDIDEEL